MPVLKRLITTVVAMLLLSAAAGYAWAQLARPANWVVQTGGSIVLTEAAARHQFSVIAVFMGVGVVASLVWGWLTSLVLRDLGWWLTPLVVLATIAAAIIAWRLGIILGPDGPLAAVNPAVGEKLPSKLAVDSAAPFVAWPIGGLLGVLLGTWLSRSESVDDGTAGEPLAAGL